MFDKWRLNCKINAFRNKTVKCIQYDEEQHVAILKAGWWHKAVVAFKLVGFDTEVQLAFSGDAITRDGEALAHVMRAMWNSKLPEFPTSPELRKQLWGKEDNREIFFRDMAAHVMGMPNEVRVTTVASYLIDN